MKTQLSQFIGKKKYITSACLLMSTFLTLPSNAAIDTDDPEVHRLDLQGQIDTQAPFSKTFWAAAHNAYAAKNWNDGSYTDVNQFYSPLGMLRRGIRLLEYDPKPASIFSSTPHLCHMSNPIKDTVSDTIGYEIDSNDWVDCSYMSAFGMEPATLGDGLDEIKNFIEEGNRDQVIFLKLEDYQNKYHNNFLNKVGERIESRLGDYVFKPSDLYPGNTCASLPVQTLTKQDILNAGRNVVIFSQTDRNYNRRDGKDLCDYKTKGNSNTYRDNVWIGMDVIDSDGKLYKNQPLAQNNSLVVDSNISTHYDLGNFSVSQDGVTEFSKFTDSEVKLYGERILENARAGYNILEPGLIEANGTNLAIPDAPRIKDFVWSWKEGHPTQNEDICGRMTTDGEISNLGCDAPRPYACVDDNRNWHITNATGNWYNGYAACAAEGYAFGMPFNARESAQLFEQRNNDNISTAIYVNYYRAFEDFWVANQDEYVDVEYVKKDPIGGTGGDAFDNIDLLKRKMLVNGDMNLASVQINANDSRVRGLKACYEFNNGDNDLCVEYGNSGGSWGNAMTFNTSKGEYLNHMQVCTGTGQFSNGSVYFLRFTDSNGKTVSGGSQTNTQSCQTYWSTADQQIFAFHGREGSEPIALGVYKISNQLISK